MLYLHIISALTFVVAGVEHTEKLQLRLMTSCNPSAICHLWRSFTGLLELPVKLTSGRKLKTKSRLCDKIE